MDGVASPARTAAASGVGAGPVAAVAMAAVAVLLLALGVVVQAARLDIHRERQERLEDVRAAAWRSVTAFTTVDYRDFDQGLSRVLAGATGEFARRYSTEAAALRERAALTRAVSRGRVLEVGIVAAESTAARALVVADSTVSNSTVPARQRRSYRIRLDLVWDGRRWLTSDLDLLDPSTGAAGPTAAVVG